MVRVGEEEALRPRMRGVRQCDQAARCTLAFGTKGQGDGSVSS
jgi:hypothetical protein